MILEDVNKDTDDKVQDEIKSKEVNLDSSGETTETNSNDSIDNNNINNDSDSVESNTNQQENKGYDKNKENNNIEDEKNKEIENNKESNEGTNEEESLEDRIKRLEMELQEEKTKRQATEIRSIVKDKLSASGLTELESLIDVNKYIGNIDELDKDISALESAINNIVDTKIKGIQKESIKGGYKPKIENTKVVSDSSPKNPMDYIKSLL